MNAPDSVAPTPRQRLDEDQRRTQIMAATVAELAQRGYHGTSLTKIVERAGVSKGLLWHYFTGKDDLMEATAKATMATIRYRVAELLDLSQPVPDVLRAALRHAAALGRTHREELGALDDIVRSLRNPDGSPKMTLDYYEDTYRVLERLFRRGQREGTLRDFDTRVMAVTYQGAIDTMISYLGTHPDVDPTRYADQLADILLAGTLAR